MRELYLNSEPKIDITKARHQINPNDHKIMLSKFDEIIKKHGLKTNENLMIFLNKAPKLIQG